MTDKPLLILNRLIVTSRGKSVYDEPFHKGVNIIRGGNGSGKSTIIDMIYYVLGGANVHWTDEAELCDTIYAEFSVSGLIISLSRDIGSNENSIGVCEGSLANTMSAVADWSFYGMRRTENKESFSQFMFEHIGFPTTQSDDGSVNVTMYQVLRLIFADQNTDNTSLFRRERQPFADRQDIRRAVGEMLLGIDDLKGHDLRLEFRRVEQELAEKHGRLTSLYDAAVKVDPNFSLIHYSNSIDTIGEEVAKLESEIETIAKVQQSDNNPGTGTEQQRAQIIEEKLSELQNFLGESRKNISLIEAQLLDSEYFIDSLRNDLDGLTSANSARSLIGDASLQFCPVCLAKLAALEPDKCPLCNSGASSDSISGGRIRIEQELKHQIAESEKLNIMRRVERDKIRELIRKREVEREHFLTELRELVNPVAGVDADISSRLRKIGYLERHVEELKRLDSLKREVEGLETEVQLLQTKADHMSRELKRRHEAQEARRLECQEKIGQLTISVLHRDIVDRNNDTLQDATGLVYSFEKDFLSVRHGRLSASTQVFLKNSFYLGLLQFSIEDSQSRLPRFFMLDNIEDKGMVPERFRNFHKLLIDYSESVDVDHQVILTTSYIDDSLQGSKYCVGPSYDQPPFTLNFERLE